MILLDTHVLVWLAKADETLGRQSRDIIERNRQAGTLAFSAISLWEIGLLTAKRRLQLGRSPDEFRKDLLAGGAAELPLTGLIGIAASALETLHGDPADRFIVATALAHKAALMTADGSLLKWRHALPRHNALK